MSDALVTRSDFDDAELTGWSWHDGEVPCLVCGFGADTYTGAAAFALEVAQAADDAVHHPDIDIRYQRFARVALTTHGSGGVTQLDLDLAATINRLADRSSITIGADTPR